MTRLRILSDLHLESGPWTWSPAGEDILVLAGDIASLQAGARRRQLWRAIGESGIPAVYVLGNHEGYGDWFPRAEIVGMLRGELPGNITLLDRESVSIHGLRFLGCSLWTDFSLREQGSMKKGAQAAPANLTMFEQSINDFNYLCMPQRVNGSLQRIRATDMADWHRADVAWLNEAIAASDVPTVVVTHFLPSPDSIHAQYRGSLMNPYFATDCRALMKSPVRLWIHGHTHSSCDYVSNGVRVVCNPRGYASYGQQENRSFRSDLQVDV